LIKEDDEFARRGAGALIVEDKPNSVASGRSMEEIAADPDRVWHSNKSVAENVKTGAVRKRKVLLDVSKLAGARKAKMPAFVEPELARLVKDAPAGDEWIHEMKYDGYRMLCRIEAAKATMWSRNGNEWTQNFSALTQSAVRLPVEDAWIDGEVIVMDQEGRSSFQALQNALSDEDANKLNYYVFRSAVLEWIRSSRCPSSGQETGLRKTAQIAARKSAF